MKDATSPALRPVVGDVAKIGPTFVPSLRRLIGANSNIRQGEPLDDIRLDFDLSCGIAALNIGTDDFELGLRTCFVSLELANCEMIVASRYEYRLGSGEIKATATERTTTESSRNADISVGATAEQLLGFGLLAKFGLGASRKRGAKTEEVTQRDVQIDLVVTSGQYRWRVGDMIRGDARRQDGILSGDYFLEKRGKDGEPEPLCRLQCTEPHDPMHITISVTAAFSSMLVFQANRAQHRNDVLTEEVREKLKRRSAKAEIEHDELLRAHIAGFVAAKRLRAKQLSENLVDNEFMIARLTLQCSGAAAKNRAEDKNA